MDISNGKLPFFEEYIIDNLANRAPFREEKTLENYFFFLKIQKMLYKMEYKSRGILETTSFSEFLNQEKQSNLAYLKSISSKMEEIENLDRFDDYQDEDADEEEVSTNDEDVGDDEN